MPDCPAPNSPLKRGLGVRSNWIKRIEPELASGVALPECVFGNPVVATRWMRAKLPVGREYDKASGRTSEQQAEKTGDTGNKFRRELQEPPGRSVSTPLAK